MSFINQHFNGQQQYQRNLGTAIIGSLGMPGLRPDGKSETKRDCSRKV